MRFTNICIIDICKSDISSMNIIMIASNLKNELTSQNKPHMSLTNAILNRCSWNHTGE